MVKKLVLRRIQRLVSLNGERNVRLRMIIVRVRRVVVAVDSLSSNVLPEHFTFSTVRGFWEVRWTPLC